MGNKVEEAREVDQVRRLTEPSYWNSLWTSSNLRKIEIVSHGRGHQFVERLIGSERLNGCLNGWQHLFWTRLLPRFVIPNPSGRILELGSGPGNLVLQFHRLFGYAPYGVEYTSAGAEANRRNFSAHGIAPAQVFEADAFLPCFQAEHRGRYDAVMSCGLIEHFTDLEPVISAHVNLLKPGGLLVVRIPNLRGLNHWQVQRWAADQLVLHNLEIMDSTRFRALFARPDLDELFCAPMGGINLLMADSRAPRKTLRLLRKIQVVINVLQSSFGTVEGRWWSPQLVYIGRKRKEN